MTNKSESSRDLGILQALQVFENTSDVKELRRQLEGLKSKEKAKEGSFTLKQQILLLEALGILDYPKIKKLSDSKKAILFSALLNRGEKSIKDHLNNLNKKNPNPDFIVRKNDNIKAVEELLKSLGISKEDKKK